MKENSEIVDAEFEEIVESDTTTTDQPKGIRFDRQHPQFKTIMRNIAQQKRLLKLSQGFHPTKSRPSADERKSKRKSQKAARRKSR